MIKTMFYRLKLLRMKRTLEKMKGELRKGRQEAGKRVYTALYQEQDYNNVKNLQNKLKSILDELLAD